jgi:asparagine synthase (glutamine-hydrolysing)
MGMPPAPAGHTDWIIEIDPDAPSACIATAPAIARLDDGERQVAVIGWLDGDLHAAGMLAAYEQSGVEAFGKARGQFVALLWDGPERVFWAVRDPMGAHPLFFACPGRKVLVSPSARRLVRHPMVGTSVNQMAIADFFRDSWPEASETYYERIRRVPPGHGLRLRNGEAICERYWLRRHESVAWLRETEIEDFDTYLDQAVGRCLGSGPSALFLSGGLDSVSVGAVAADLGRRLGAPPMRALSLVFPDKESNEEAAQRAVAQRLGMTHNLQPLEEAGRAGDVIRRSLAESAALDSPVLNVWLPSYRRLAEAGRQKGCTTVLTGTGGDEWLGVSPLLGADLLGSLRMGAWARLLSLRWRSYRQARSARASWNYLWHFSVRPLVRRAVLRVGTERYPELIAARRRRRAMGTMPEWLAPDERMRRVLAERSERFDGMDDLRHSGSFYVDEIRMALDHPLASLEAEEWFHAFAPTRVRVRHPFYDPDLVEFLFRVPPERLLDGGRSKGLVRGTLERRFPGLGFGVQAKVEATSYFAIAVRAQGRALWREWSGLPALVSLGIVEPEGARRAMERALQGSRYRDLYYFWSMMNMEAWLRPRV